MAEHKPFTLSALLRLTRFWNLVIIALAQYFAAVFLIARDHLFDPRLFFLSLSTAIVAAAGYVINDYYDIKIDLINKPARVVVGKEIPRRFALLFHSVLSLTGVAIGFFLGWRIGIINFFSAFLLWWYSNNLKRQPFVGNFVVAVLTGISIVLVNVLYGVENSTVIVYAIFAFFMTLVREIIKDMEDWKGDTSFGCRTLPIIWGQRRTKFLLYAILLIFSTVVLLINRFYLGLPMYYFLVFLFIPLAWLLALLIRSDTVRNFYRLSQLCKVIMLLGIVSMIFI